MSYFPSIEIPDVIEVFRYVCECVMRQNEIGAIVTVMKGWRPYKMSV